MGGERKYHDTNPLLLHKTFDVSDSLEDGWHCAKRQRIVLRRIVKNLGKDKKVRLDYRLQLTNFHFVVLSKRL